MVTIILLSECFLKLLSRNVLFYFENRATSKTYLRNLIRFFTEYKKYRLMKNIYRNTRIFSEATESLKYSLHVYRVQVYLGRLCRPCLLSYRVVFLACCYLCPLYTLNQVNIYFILAHQKDVTCLSNFQAREAKISYLNFLYIFDFSFRKNLLHLLNIDRSNNIVT